jgi:hypothetical protein
MIISLKIVQYIGRQHFSIRPRPISTHNPTFLKASAVGDHLVNGAPFPANGYF